MQRWWTSVLGFPKTLLPIIDPREPERRAKSSSTVICQASGLDMKHVEVQGGERQTYKVTRETDALSHGGVVRNHDRMLQNDSGFMTAKPHISQAFFSTLSH